jgi:hypothetical protein
VFTIFIIFNIIWTVSTDPNKQNKINQHIDHLCFVLLTQMIAKIQFQLNTMEQNDKLHKQKLEIK